MYVASPIAQRRAITPWSMLGGRGGNCIAAIVDEPEDARCGWCGADQENSPRSSRFRPQLRPTFRLGPCEPLRTTYRCCFVLLPRLPRRKKEDRAFPDRPQGVADTKRAQFADVE